MDKVTDSFLREYISLKKSIDSATARLKEIEGQLKSHMADNGIKKLEVDDHAVTLVVADTRSFDAAALKSLVSASVFNQITEPKVSTSLFDAAVKLGKISADVAEAVTSKTPYMQLRVK